MTFSTDYARCEPTKQGKRLVGKCIQPALTGSDARQRLGRAVGQTTFSGETNTRSDDLLSATGSIRKQSCRNSGCRLDTVYAGKQMWSEKLAFGLIPHPTSLIDLWTNHE